MPSGWSRPACSTRPVPASPSSATSSPVATPAARAPGDRVVVSPVGLALDDVTAAKHVLDRAQDAGLGTTLRLRSGPPVWE